MGVARLRLGQLTAFILRIDTCDCEQVRLVVYTCCQKEPAFISRVYKAEPVLVVEDFDADQFSPFAARESKLCVRVFKTSTEKQEWSLLASHFVDLTQFYPGQSSASLAVQVEGETYTFDSSPPKQRVPSHISLAAANLRQTIGMKTTGIAESVSFNMLVRIVSIQNARDDALISTLKTSEKIDKRLQGPTREQVVVLESKLDKIGGYAQLVKQKTSSLRENVLKSYQDSEKHAKTLETSLETPAFNTGEQPLSLSDDIRKQQSRIAANLMNIFPIEPMSDSFYFTICELPLPSVHTINHFDPVQVGAALGLVAQLVLILSRYLDVHLPFPIQPLGSQSYISDPISNIRGSRIFPLWTQGALLYRVEYALYLLHKDIEQLLAAKQIAVVDLKQTLANLKNLMLVMAS